MVQTYIPSLFHLANCFLHILIFLSLPSIQLNSLILSLSSTGMLIALSVLILVVVLEVVLMVWKKKEFYLLFQMLTVRFIISALLTLVALDLYSSSNISSSLCLAVCVMTQIVSYLLSEFILFETYRIFALRTGGTRMVTDMAGFEILLISLDFVSSGVSGPMISLLLFITSIDSVVTYFGRKTLDVQFNVLYMIRVVHLGMASFLIF